MDIQIIGTISGPIASIVNRASPAAATGVTDDRVFQLPEDGYTQLFPFGEFPGVGITSDGRELPIVQVLDRQAAEAMVATLTEEQLIDYEHFSQDKTKETRSAGWLPAADGVQIRADGLYTRNRWSKSGRADIEGGDYRFISPEFEDLEHLGGNRVRPRKLSGAGLTNKPELRTLKPLSNRQHATTHSEPNNIMLEKLKTILGLQADATEDAVLTAAARINNRAKEADTITAERDKLLADLVDSDLEQFASVIDEADKEETRKMLVLNRAGTRKLLAGAQAKLAAGGGDPAAPEVPAKVYNKATAKPPGDVVEKANAEADLRAAKVLNRANEISREEKLPFATAWNRAEAEIPAATAK